MIEDVMTAAKKSPQKDAPQRMAWRIDDACSALNISRSHFYDLVAEGRIKIIRIGKASRLPDAEMQRILREGV